MTPLLIETNERGKWEPLGLLPSRDDPHFFLGIFLTRVVSLQVARMTLTHCHATLFWEKPVKL